MGYGWPGAARLQRQAPERASCKHLHFASIKLSRQELKGESELAHGQAQPAHGASLDKPRAKIMERIFLRGFGVRDKEPGQLISSKTRASSLSTEPGLLTFRKVFFNTTTPRRSKAAVPTPYLSILTLIIVKLKREFKPVSISSQGLSTVTEHPHIRAVNHFTTGCTSEGSQETF